MIDVLYKKKSLRRSSLLTAAAGLCLAVMSGAALAQEVTADKNYSESTNFTTEKSLGGRKISISVEMLSLKIDKDNQLQTAGLGIALNEPLSENLSFGLNFNQGYSETDHYTALFYGTRLYVSYGLLGYLNDVTETIYVEGVPQLISKSKRGGGVLGVEVGLSQYFFNTGDNALPFSGVGCFLFYDFSLFGFDLGTGLGLERMTSGKVLLMPIRGLLRVSTPI